MLTTEPKQNVLTDCVPLGINLRTACIMTSYLYEGKLLEKRGYGLPHTRYCLNFKC